MTEILGCCDLSTIKYYLWRDQRLGATFLAVRLAAMADAEDSHDVVLEQKQNAVVAEAQSKGACHVAMQGRDMAATGAGEVENAVEEQQSGGSV